MVDEYIAGFSKETGQVLARIKQIISEEVPEGVWSISYGVPVIKKDGKYVIYFGGYKEHVSLYPIPAGPESFLAKINEYIAGKGTLRFYLDKPVPYELVREVVKYSLKRHGPV